MEHLHHFYSLSVFTIMAQAAAGMAILKALFESGDEKRKFPAWGLTALLLFLIGGAASLSHLGYPLNAPYTITNLFTSWLSREIWAVGFFGLLLVLSLFLPHIVIRWLLAASGALLVYVISHVYIVENIAAWNSYLTLIIFSVTSILLGAATLLVVDIFRMHGDRMELHELFCSWKPVVIALAFIVRVVLVPLEVIRAEGAVYIPLLDSHLTFLSCSVVFGGLLLFRNRLQTAAREKDQTGGFLALVLLAALLLYGAELCGRLFFYSHYSKFGM